jgi:hypothetical protein
MLIRLLVTAIVRRYLIGAIVRLKRVIEGTEEQE